MTIKALHYDMKELKITEIELVSLKRVQHDYLHTTDKSRDYIFAAEVYPASMKNKLQTHLEQVKKVRQALSLIEGQVYELLNESSVWRNSESK
jgi:hypothetical protein